MPAQPGARSQVVPHNDVAAVDARPRRAHAGRARWCWSSRSTPCSATPPRSRAGRGLRRARTRCWSPTRRTRSASPAAAAAGCSHEAGLGRPAHVVATAHAEQVARRPGRRGARPRPRCASTWSTAPGRSSTTPASPRPPPVVRWRRCAVVGTSRERVARVHEVARRAGRGLRRRPARRAPCSRSPMPGPAGGGRGRREGRRATASASAASGRRRRPTASRGSGSPRTPSSTTTSSTRAIEGAGRLAVTVARRHRHRHRGRQDGRHRRPRGRRSSPSDGTVAVVKPAQTGRRARRPRRPRRGTPPRRRLSRPTRACGCPTRSPRTPPPGSPGVTLPGLADAARSGRPGRDRSTTSTGGGRRRGPGQPRRALEPDRPRRASRSRMPRPGGPPKCLCTRSSYCSADQSR